jgi:hypothetical protein
MNNIVDDFPLTIIEGRKLNREQWDFGDALLEECGAPSEAAKHDGSRHRIVEAVAALKPMGRSTTSATSRCCARSRGSSRPIAGISR